MVDTTVFIRPREPPYHMLFKYINHIAFHSSVGAISGSVIAVKVIVIGNHIERIQVIMNIAFKLASHQDVMNLPIRLAILFDVINVTTNQE